MRLIEADKVVPLCRLLMYGNPAADAIADEIQSLVNAHIVDPIHAAGGCYCRECNGCEQVMFSYFCSNPNAPWYDEEYAVQVEANDFCSYGRRREAWER